MFIKVKKNSDIYMSNNSLSNKQMVVPVTSNFLINLDQVSEISFYTVKENQQRLNLEGEAFTIPLNTRVIHLQMGYRYSSHQKDLEGVKNRMVNERAYYKLYFLPDCPGEYELMRSRIEEQVCNL